MHRIISIPSNPFPSEINHRLEKLKAKKTSTSPFSKRTSSTKHLNIKTEIDNPPIPLKKLLGLGGSRLLTEPSIFQKSPPRVIEILKQTRIDTKQILTQLRRSKQKTEGEIVSFDKRLKNIVNSSFIELPKKFNRLQKLALINHRSQQSEVDREHIYNRKKSQIVSKKSSQKDIKIKESGSLLQNTGLLGPSKLSGPKQTKSQRISLDKIKNIPKSRKKTLDHDSIGGYIVDTQQQEMDICQYMDKQKQRKQSSGKQKSKRQSYLDTYFTQFQNK